MFVLRAVPLICFHSASFSYRFVLCKTRTNNNRNIWCWNLSDKKIELIKFVLKELISLVLKQTYLYFEF